MAVGTSATHTFNYTVSDGTASDTASVDVTVNGTFDAAPGEVRVYNAGGAFVATYTTITDAINAGTTLDGFIVEVGAGTYDENVIVNKQLTIVGSGPNTIIEGTFTEDNPSIGASLTEWLKTRTQAQGGYNGNSGNGITIAASNVTIQNIAIHDFLQGVSISSAAALTNITIDGVDVSNFINGIVKETPTEVTDLDDQRRQSGGRLPRHPAPEGRRGDRQECHRCRDRWHLIRQPSQQRNLCRDARRHVAVR